jgi:hypothetical protein
MQRAAKIAAVGGAACGTALIASRVWYGEWTWPMQKYAVRLRLRRQPPLHELTPCCNKHGTSIRKIIRDADVCANALRSHELNFMTTDHPECVRNQLSLALIANGTQNGIHLTYPAHDQRDRRQGALHEWILRKLGAVPPPRNVGMLRWLMHECFLGYPPDAAGMLENYLPENSCIIITNNGTYISQYYVDVKELQDMCKRKNITIVIIQRER